MLCCCELLCYQAGGVLLWSVWDGDLLSVTTSPDLVSAALAMLSPPMHTGEAFKLLVCHHSSHSISFISAASISGSSQRTPSPVVTRWRPICPSVMHRTNLSQGVSSPSRNVTHALAGCRGIHRCQSRGRHSRFRSLPNRS